MRYWIAMAILGGLAIAAPRKNGQAEILLERAVQKETADGDLKAALELYKQAVAKAGADRGIAAKALIRMGQCYEKLGNADARKTFERVVREFGDQKEAVAEARRRLGTGEAKPAVMARRIDRPDHNERVQDVSLDGRLLLCNSNDGAIYLREVESGEKRTILAASTDKQEMRHPLRLSPDAGRVAYIYRPGPGGPPAEIHVVRTDGTGLRAFTSKELGGIPRMPTLSGWTPDGQNILVSITSADQKGRLVLVRAADGVVRDLGTAADMSGSIKQIRLSPDGSFIAYAKSGGAGYMGKGIAVRTLDGSRDVTISPDGTYPLWSPDGKRILFVSNRRGPTDLWAIPVANGQPTGPAEMLRESLDYPIGMTRSGEIFHSTIIEMRHLYTVDFDPATGRPASKITRITERYSNAGGAWSPDGKLLAYASLRDGREPGMGEPASLVIRTVATGEERVVTPKLPLDMNLANPQWFPDNRSLLIQPQWGLQSGSLAKVDIVTGDVQLLPRIAAIKNSGTWYDPGVTLSPDGKSLYYAAFGTRPDQPRILQRELASGADKELGTVTTTVQPQISVSPDGAKLAFWTLPGQTQREKVLITMPSSGGEPRVVTTGAGSIDWGLHTQWSADGKRIYFVGHGGKPGTDWRGQESDIYSVPAEGGDPVPFGIGLHVVLFFHIHPSGNRAVFYDEYYPKPEVWSVKNLPGVGGR